MDEVVIWLRNMTLMGVFLTCDRLFIAEYEREERFSSSNRGFALTLRCRGKEERHLRGWQPLRTLLLAELRSAQINEGRLAFMQEGKGKAHPAIGPTWRSGVAILGQAQAGKTQYRCLPNCSTACIMNSLCCVQTQILKIN